jgi:hypothetical protein
MPMDVEHLIPEARGGETTEENLWLACPRCNAHKADRVAATDPNTGDIVRLFDPRRQKWGDHFLWTDDGIRKGGRTPTGRATVVALHLNRPMLVAARQAWVLVGWHPPAADVAAPPADKGATQEMTDGLARSSRARGWAVIEDARRNTKHETRDRPFSRRVRV